MDNEKLKALMPITSRPSVLMHRGEGSYVWDVEGKRYLDFVQGWAVNSLGHTPVEVRRALETQSALLLSPSPAYHNAPQLELAATLTKLSGLHHAFFTCTGADANEGALKLCRKWGQLNKSGAYELITTHGGFHGRTLAMTAAAGKPGWDALFPPNLPGFVKVPFGDAEAVRGAISERTVAIMVEPIQGEGGVVVPPAGYLRELRQIADERDLLLVLDEVQTGMGRTGRLFAFQQEDATPDILTLGKGIGSGVPLGALLASERASVFAHGDQGGTYNGNPLMTAVGLAVVQTIAEPAFLAHVREMGARLTSVLESLVGEMGRGSVRGRGLLLALELGVERAVEVRDLCFEAGLLLNAVRPTTLRFMPSLRVTPDEIDEMAGILRSVLGRISE